jgi:hypothetical protein
MTSLAELRRGVSEWLRKHAEKGILLLIRRSSGEQKNNVGSHEFQKNQARHFARYGIEDLPYEILDRIESAKEGRERAVVDEMISRMANGTLGLIVAGFGSRVTRDEVDGARLIGGAQKHGVLFMIAGNVLDPRDQHQHARLMEIIINARLENAERQFVIASTGHELAMKGQYRTPLPTGFLWVAKGDTRYREMLSRTNYADWATPEALERHTVIPERPGVTYYALPDPFPDVFEACSLLTGWMIETRDPREVLERVRRDSRYPRPGLLPWQPTSHFARAKATQWKPVTARSVWVWFSSWGLYGAYHYDPKVLRSFGLEYPAVQIEGAFPSLLRPEDRAEVLELIGDARRLYRANGYEGPRNFVLPRVVCWHPGPDGTPCGHRIYPTYQRNVAFRYMGWPQAHNGHTKQVPADIGDVALRLVAEAFEPKAVEAAIATLRRGGTDTGPRKAELNRMIQKLTGRIKIAVELEVNAADSKDEEEARKEYHQSVKDLTATRSRHQAELAKLEREASRHRTLASDDYDRMRALAGDVPALLQAARAIEEQEEERWRETGSFDLARTGIVRRIVGRLVREVQVRLLARGAYHVDVVFRNGATASSGLFTVGMKCSQPELAWIAHRHAEGASPEEVAAEINSVPGRGYSREQFAPWTADRVRMALVRLAYGDLSAAAPEGKYRSARELAGITGASEEGILGLGFIGRIGPARVENGQLCFRASMEALDRWIPEYAKARIARRKDWPLDDVSEVRDDHAGTSCTRSTLRYAAENGRLNAIRDRSGRLYARVSEMRTIDVSLEQALSTSPKEWQALDQSRWLRPEQVQERFPGVSRPTLAKYSAHVLRQGRIAWYYVDESAEAAFARPTLEEAVAALGDETLRVADFHSLDGLAAMLQVRYGRGSRAFVVQSVKGSNVLTVVGWRQARPRPYDSLYVHVPEAVLASGFDQTGKWLRGKPAATDGC